MPGAESRALMHDRGRQNGDTLERSRRTACRAMAGSGVQLDAEWTRAEADDHHDWVHEMLSGTPGVRITHGKRCRVRRELSHPLVVAGRGGLWINLADSPLTSGYESSAP